ncbi:hypothetical protein Gpo141_00009034 [Globisporangium polare]
MSAKAIEGRVFDRWRHFQTLPAELQADVQSIRTFLSSEEGKKDVFTSKAGAAKAKAAPPVTSAPGKVLLAAIQKKLEELKGKEDEKVPSEYVHKVADALVLSGFITPTKDAGAILEGYAFETDVFVAVGADITGDTGTKTIWNVKDGAIQAGKLKRKRTGFFAKLTGGGKAQSYVVANETTKTLYVYEGGDTARTAPVVSLDLSGASVEFNSTIEHGVKVTVGGAASAGEIFGAESKEKAEEWLNSIINAGATYREVYNTNVEAIKSFYELKDFDMQGKEVSMDKYKGKVVLVVNVSSLCGLTPTNYPELTLLDEKYRDQGLEILAFPCNQFSNQEPGTHEEIMEFVKQYKCTFPFFEKHDVNGASARPVFTYLKAKLPGSFGNFVKWNFTKFLVDRNGQPYKRFAPKDLPLSFEDEIKKLLDQPATVAAAEESPAEEKTPVAVEENEPKPSAAVPIHEQPPTTEDQAAAEVAATEEEKPAADKKDGE